MTAPGDDGYDFVSRYFAPAKGIPEDPVTGAAHCMLAPYWGKRLDKSAFRAFQASRRGGEVACRLAGDRVELEGVCASIGRRSGNRKLSSRRRCQKHGDADFTSFDRGNSHRADVSAPAPRHRHRGHAVSHAAEGDCGRAQRAAAARLHRESGRRRLREGDASTLPSGRRSRAPDAADCRAAHRSADQRHPSRLRVHLARHPEPPRKREQSCVTGETDSRRPAGGRTDHVVPL